MDNVFIVEASFDDYECSSTYILGLFTNEEDAKKTKTKWDNFFEKHSNIFSDLKSDDDDDDDIYYRTLAKYSCIKQFSGISIYPLPLNKDIFNSKEYSENRSDDMNNLIKEWNRDYKINDIISNTQSPEDQS